MKIAVPSIMLSFFYIIMVCLLLSGCGDGSHGDVLVTLTHHQDYAEMQAHSPTVPVVGYAEWAEDENGQAWCEIYMMYREWYPDDLKYQEVLGHELRHCFEGHFHDRPNY